MAKSCKARQESFEEEVLQPVDKWVEQQEERCRNEPCNPWLLCLNVLVCWLVTVTVKVVVWVATLVVRLVYRIVCTFVSLVIGLLALLVGNADILMQAVSDLVELAKDAFFFALGAVIFEAIRFVDMIQTVIGRQPDKRRLTKREREILQPIFRDSLLYPLIQIVDGPAGVLTMFDRPFTMGFTIYLPSYSDQTLVHECVHVWQFQYGGFGYIGNSAMNQLYGIFNPVDEYDWKPGLDAGETWYTLQSIEAQANFIDDIWGGGHFVFADIDVPADFTPGAFFREEDAALGSNAFIRKDPDDGDGVDTFTTYTDQANDAWRILRTV
jgi:hypothetical protein